MERRQVLGQVQADMLFAALVGGGLPEQVLCGMGETAGRQATRRQPDTDQDPVRIAAAGAQGVITGRISATSSVRSRMVFFLVIHGAGPS